jgi:hypothetical protein
MINSILKKIISTLHPGGNFQAYVTDKMSFASFVYGMKIKSKSRLKSSNSYFLWKFKHKSNLSQHFRKYENFTHLSWKTKKFP